MAIASTWHNNASLLFIQLYGIRGAFLIHSGTKPLSDIYWRIVWADRREFQWPGSVNRTQHPSRASLNKNLRGRMCVFSRANCMWGERCGWIYRLSVRYWSQLWIMKPCFWCESAGKIGHSQHVSGRWHAWHYWNVKTPSHCFWSNWEIGLWSFWFISAFQY